jgi:hypothetical protein
MLHKNGKKAPGKATYASVKKEMAAPRIAKSARMAEQSLKKGTPVDVAGTAKDLDRDNKRRRSY